MRPGFEGSLYQYRDIAEGFREAAKGERSMGDMATILNWHIEKEAKASTTTPEAQFRIFSIQQKKQEIMVWLKGELKKLDDPEATHEQPEGTVRVRQRKNGDLYIRQSVDGKSRKIPVTVGELITDADWGIRYYLDPETVPRNIRKQCLVEEAKRRLHDFLDEQLTEEVLGRYLPKEEEIFDEEAQKTKEYKKHRLENLQRIYTTLRNERQNRIERGGHIFERMVRNFLRKLIIDHDLACELDKGDIQQDVEQITDFILRKFQRDRGVGVFESQRPDVIIQVTQNVKPSVLARKGRQVREAKERLRQEPETTIADILLVAIPSANGRESLQKWEENGRLPGGPERYWTPEFQEQVYRAVLKGFFTPEELDEFWSKVHPETSETDSAEAEAA